MGNYRNSYGSTILAEWMYRLLKDTDPRNSAGWHIKAVFSFLIVGKVEFFSSFPFNFNKDSFIVELCKTI